MKYSIIVFSRDIDLLVLASQLKVRASPTRSLPALKHARRERLHFRVKYLIQAAQTCVFSNRISRDIEAAQTYGFFQSDTPLPQLDIEAAQTHGFFKSDIPQP